MVEEATSQFGRMDILVNNAGTTEFISFKNLEAADLEAWERIFRVNVIGAFQMARAARAMELTSGKGHIVNVSSIAGLNATGSSIPYAASKAWQLNNITISLARTLAPTIRVNAVAPGFITGRWLEDGLGENYEKFQIRLTNNSLLVESVNPKTWLTQFFP